MIRLFAIAAVALAVAACGEGQDIDPDRQVGPNPVLPEPAEPVLLPPMNFPGPVGWKAGESPTVPRGFRIQKMAEGLLSPRTVYPLPNGDILVVQSLKTEPEPIDRPKTLMFQLIMGLAHSSSMGGPTNRIVLLRDSNGDGMPEGQSVLLDKLNAPFGVTLVGNDLYVAETDKIMRYRYTPGQTRITEPGQKIVDLPAGPRNHHWTRDLTASPDGSRLYVSAGSNSNVQEHGVEEEANRAAILEVDPRTGAFGTFATGHRNPNGLTFYPGSNVLWTVVNERDELGSNLPPDYLTSVRRGGFYGWPYSYWGRNVDKRVRPQRPDLVATALVPDYALGSHVAPLGLTFYTASSFPARYRGGAFVGEHGSWNRSKFNGYKVVFIRFENGRPAGKPEEFVTGFVGPDGEVRGRPVGVAIDRTGALIIADDVGNAVWRVSYASPPPVRVTRARQIGF